MYATEFFFVLLFNFLQLLGSVILIGARIAVVLIVVGFLVSIWIAMYHRLFD